MIKIDQLPAGDLAEYAIGTAKWKPQSAAEIHFEVASLVKVKPLLSLIFARRLYPNLLGATYLAM